MQKTLVVLFILFVVTSYGQTKCEYINDSLILSKKESVNYVETKIKNNYQIQFISFQNKKFLRIVVRDNLGFGKTSSLLLYCSKKQIYIKSISLQPLDKNSAYFLIELNPNYLATVKDFGLNSIIFNETTEFSVPKLDSESIKKTANCFFELSSK